MTPPIMSPETLKKNCENYRKLQKNFYTDFQNFLASPNSPTLQLFFSVFSKNTRNLSVV